MSDFDKEAEREKLREKYGEEEEKRKATEQMSELLLKGATMTNAHCTDCGDPIFRYDGQEFCPTCQKPVARDQSEEGADGDETQGDHIEVADPSDDATVQFGGQAAADQRGADTQDAAEGAVAPPANGAAGGDADPEAASDAGHPPAAEGEMGDATREIPSADPDRTPASTDAVATGSDASASTDPVAPETDPSTPERRVPSQGGSSRHSGTEDAVASELSAAESLLAETVHRFARRAADTDDPRTAREHLKAAREAAEALDELRY